MPRPLSPPRRLGVGVLGLTALVAAPLSAIPASAAVTPHLSEIHYDNDGTDTGEAVEITADPGSDLSGWSVVFYNGSGGTTYATRALGVVPPSGALVLTHTGIQNGAPDGLALVNGSSVVQFLSYEGPMTATDGPASGMTSTDIGVAEGSSTPAGHSLQLVDGAWVGPRANTFGTPGTGGGGGGSEEPPPSNVCGDPAAFIHQVQGSGARFDPAYGGTQTVEGVVSAVMPGLRGFYVQEQAADHDDDPTTSEGVFVFTGSSTPALAAGQLVRVTGEVSDFGSGGSTMTQLSRATIQACDADVAAPAATPVTFPLADPADLEHYEGMLVTLEQDLVISEYFNYDRFGEVVLALPPNGWDRLHTPTSVVEPGAPAQALAADYATRRITLDDGRTSQNPSTVPHPGNGEPFSLENRFRGGDTVTGVTGVVDHSFGLYRLQPTGYGSYSAQNPRPTDAPAVGGDVQVASFNVLNYFLTLDDGTRRCGPDGHQQFCRGADANQPQELPRQRAKLLAALSAMDADVVGLMEMENTPGVEPAADLVAGLNEMHGAGTYDYVDTGVVGTDAIRLGFLYKPGVVRLAGDFAVLDASVDPRFEDDRNRPMLTQTFDEVATGARFTVSVNHLKSKGSACGAADPDTRDGSGNCNLTRTRAAEAIVDFLATDPTRSGDPDHLVIGDLNAYDHEDPIDALVAGGFEDQVKRFGGELAYGYTFDGQVGYLDHALSSQSLRSQVTGTQEWHINSDEPDLLDYDTSFKSAAQDALYAADPFRSSDHDPVLVGLDLTPVAPAACYTGDRQSVESFTSGARADGRPVPPGLQDVAQALGTSDPGGEDPHYVTLGVGGEIVLAFASPVQNTNGTAADLRVVDADDGRKGAGDAAQVLGSWDGTTWVSLGRVTGTGEVDLAGLNAVRYVKVVDATSGALLPPTDGYDVDAVEVLTGCV